MKTSPLSAFLRPLLPVVLALPMVGCVSSGGYGGYGGVSTYGYDEPVFAGRSYSSYARPYRYSYARPYDSGYRDGSTWCGVNRSYSSGGHYNSRYYDHDYRSVGSRSGGGEKTRVKLIDYNEREKRKIPSGYHTKEWFKEKGYSLKENTYKTPDGDYRGKVPSHSKHKKD